MSKKKNFIPLEKTTDFSPVRDPALRDAISNGVSRWSLPYEADSGLIPPSAQTVKEQSSLTGFIFLILFFTLLQVSLAHYFSVFGVQPDLFLICLAVISIYCEVEYSLALSLLCGILKDIFSIGLFGVNTFFFPIFSFLLIKLSRRAALDNTPVLSVVVFFMTIFRGIINRMVLCFLGLTVPLGISFKIILVESLYTALIFSLSFRLIKKIVDL